MDEHYSITPTSPDGFAYVAQKYGWSEWERDGEPTAVAIMNLADVSEDVANDIQSILEDRHYDRHVEEVGEELPYGPDVYYAETAADLFEYNESWRAFEDSIRREARFFNPLAEAVLGSIFQNIHGLSSRHGQPVIREIGPGTDLTRLHRSRAFQNEARLREALANPERFVGTPESQFASNGRMNAKGVPVFYGATDVEVALAETRPPVGSRAVTAEFEIIRPLKVLDVAALESVLIKGSLFDPTFGQNFNRAAFLGVLSEKIVRPIMPDDEGTEYLVTQVMAEYLANHIKPALDGILYPSVQSGSEGANVALFNQSSKVEPADIGPKDKISVDTSTYTEDGEEPYYSVWHEKIPVKAASRPLGLFDITNLDDGFVVSDDYDSRTPTLRLDRSTIRVRHITKVKICQEPHDVTRHTSTRAETTSSGDAPPDDLPF